MTAADKLRELLATRPAFPGTEELSRWWRTSGELVPQVLEAVRVLGREAISHFDRSVALKTELDATRANLREATNLDDRDAQLLIMRRALRAALATWCPNDPRGDGADGDTYRMCHAALEGKDGR